MAGITATLIGLGIASTVGSVASGVIGSRAAGKAARVQAAAGTQAAQLQAQSAREALAFQKQMFATQQQNFAPWLGAGRGALANLSYLMGIPSPQQEAGTAAPAGNRLALPSGTGNLRELLDRFDDPRRRFGGARFGDEPNVIDMMEDGGGRFSPRQFSVAGDGGGIPFEGGGGVDKFNPVLAGGIPGRPGPVLAGAEGETGNLSSLVNPQAGQAGLDPLVNPELGEFGSLMQPFGEEFEAPTLESMQLTPGYQFRLQEGRDVLEHSAAARGGLLTGATAEALTRYGQDYASGEYSNVYNRALTEYQQAYNIFQQNQANQFNRLASMSGMGQTAAGQLSSAGQFAAGNVGNILLGSAGQQGRSIQQAAAARASGYYNSANAWNNALQGGVGNLSELLMLQAQRGRAPSPSDVRDFFN